MKKEILFLIFILSTIATVSATNPCAGLTDFSEAPFLGQNNAPIEYPYYITNFHQTFFPLHTSNLFYLVIQTLLYTRLLYSLYLLKEELKAPILILSLPS